uniref:Nsp1_C domain-containing protein n=1 Tax=Strongyloides papillosus TaxID=174720 RepID=A0A0N5BKU6_STREA
MSLFGSAQKPASATTGSLFGASSTPNTGSLFGNTTANTTGGSLFGSASTQAAGGSLFGSTPTQATGGSLFGSTPTQASGGSLFGNTAAPAPTATGGSLFGSTAPTSTATGGSLFGTSTTKTGTSLFGTTTTTTAGSTTTTGSSLFGSTTPTAGSSLFGTGTSTAGGSLFGSGTTTTTAGGSLFGSTTTTTTAGGSLFGSTPTAGGSLFGTSNTTATGSLFGSATKPTTGSLFGTTGSTSLFGSTPATGTANSLFSGSTAVFPTTDAKIEKPKDENPLDGEVPKPLVEQFELLSKKLKENQNLITEYSLNSAEKCLQIDGKLESLRIMMDEEKKTMADFDNKFSTLKDSSHKDYLMAEMVHKLQASLDNGTTAGAQECRNYIMSLVNEYSQCIQNYNEKIEEIYRLIDDELDNSKEKRVTEDELYEDLGRFDQHIRSLSYKISQIEDGMQSIKMLFMDNQRQKYGRFVQNPFDF